MIETYYQYKAKSWKVGWGFYGNDIAMAYYFGESIIKQMGDQGNAFLKAVTDRQDSLAEEFEQYENLGTGMIVLEENTNKDTDEDSFNWKVGNTEYKVEMDKENRQFIVESYQSKWQKFLVSLGLIDNTRYAFDLNSWTCKYGKPTEFLLAVHLATMAPDFTYRLATSPAVDTKVHVALYPINMKSEVVVYNEAAETAEATLEELLEGANKNGENLQRYKADISQIINELSKERLFLGFIPYKTYIGDIEKVESDLRGATSIQAFMERFGKLVYEETESFLGATDIVAIYNNFRKEKRYVEVLGVMLTYEEVYGTSENSVKEYVKRWQGETASALPYITKVVNHWYRNQYFVPQEVDIGGQKLAVRTMMTRLCTVLDIETSSVQSNIDEIEAIETKEKLIEYMENQREYFKTCIKEEDEEREVKQENIDREIDIIKEELERGIIGGSYQITANVPPSYYAISEVLDSEGFTGNEKVDELLRKLTVRETRSAEIIQIHNPLFEDNSMYIRSWLKEKYYIFDGKTDKQTEDGKVLTDQKIAQGKEYISGKTALEKVKTMLEECEDRENIIFMQRDLEELFTDFEFDLENIETPAQKVLGNIMPAYKPYTAWPSIYEKQESNCTKMIYKTKSSTALVAPANGIITKNQNGIIEIEFAGDDEETSSVIGMTLRIKADQGSISCNKKANDTIKRGEKIGTASSSDGMIILSLNLMTMTKQIVQVESYMRVEKMDYDTEDKEYRLSDDEKKLLYKLQLQEIDVEKGGLLGSLGIGEETQETYLKRAALMNVVFNKISSPLYPNYGSITSILGENSVAKEEGFIGYATQRNGAIGDSLERFESDTNAKYAIMNAMNGVDITKEFTLIGATRYVAIYKEASQAEKDEANKIIESARKKVQMRDRVYYITEEDYEKYLDGVLDKKINEVIYVLNKEKFVKGLEEYDQYEEEILKPFKKAKEFIKSYYREEKYLDGQERPANVDAITSVIKNNIKQEYEDLEDGRQKVTDSFSLTINANYTTRFKMTYTKGVEGKIESEVTIEAQNVINL